MNALEKAKQKPDAFEQALRDFLEFARTERAAMSGDQLGSPDDIFAYGKGIPKDAKASNLLPAAELGLSLAPGSGEAMSLRDAWDASGRAGAALQRGEYRNALSGYADWATGLLGAIPGAGIIARGTKRGAAWMDRNLPKGVNRLVDAAYPQGYVPQNTAYVIPAWHGSPKEFTKFEDRFGSNTGEYFMEQGRGHYLSTEPMVSARYGKNLYNVDIDAEPEHFIKFNKPFNQQSPYVQEALTRAGITQDEMGGIFGGVARTPEGVERLQKAGIAGLTYEGKVGAPSPYGPLPSATNYVVFDPEKLKIRGKGKLKPVSDR